MEHSMNAPVFTGGTMVLMTRWDRELAAKLVERHRITHCPNISTMVVDLLSNPEIGEHDLSFIDELPKSGSGKILWRELQKRAGELRGGAADLGKHERSALTPCSAERFETTPAPSRRARTAVSPAYRKDVIARGECGCQRRFRYARTSDSTWRCRSVHRLLL
jgi:hypothetical protein